MLWNVKKLENKLTMHFALDQDGMRVNDDFVVVEQPGRCVVELRGKRVHRGSLKSCKEYVADAILCDGADKGL